MTNVNTLGIFPDGNNYSSLITNAIANHDVLYFPEGEYIASEVVIKGTKKIIYAEEAKFKSLNNGTDTFILGTTNTALNLSKIYIGEVFNRSNSGHIFSIQGTVSHCSFTLDTLNQYNINKSIINGNDSINSSLFFNSFKGLQWYHAHTSTEVVTVPAINIISENNICSNNSWIDIRIDNPNGVFFHLECSTNGFYYNNSIKHIGVEKANNGFIFMKRCANMSIEDITYYDNNHNGGELLSDLISMDTCRNVIFKNVVRNNGNNSNKFNDIQNGNSKNTTILSCGGINPIGVFFDLGNQKVHVLNHFNSSTLNDSNAIII